MQESTMSDVYQGYEQTQGYEGKIAVAPFFSMRRLRLIYNELQGTTEFNFMNFDDFKHHILASVVPQIELNKWQSLAARR